MPRCLWKPQPECLQAGVFFFVGGGFLRGALIGPASSMPMEVRPHVGTAFATCLADEPIFDVG
jgi:hypothetical protein